MMSDRSILDTIPRFAKSELYSLYNSPQTWWLFYGLEAMRDKALDQLEAMGYVRRINAKWDTHELTPSGYEVASLIEPDDFQITIRDGKWATVRPQPAGEDLDHKYRG